MDIIKISESDNVAVALRELHVGETLQLGETSIMTRELIPAGHKLCTSMIKRGKTVVKYGLPIGHATQDIPVGSWVHTHNIKTNLSGKTTYQYQKTAIQPVTPSKPDFFQGYQRKDGRVGVRNEIWIIPTVGCVNSISQILEKKAQVFLQQNIDGIYSFTHPYGCSQLGEDHENTKKALCGLIQHPNAAGVLVLGLGCENNSVEGIKQALGEYDQNRVQFLIAQDCDDEIAQGLEMIKKLCDAAKQIERQPCAMSELIVGLKCGGSDGLSGITANPLAGNFSDRLIAQGGSAILTEVPEMFGAETILMNRCKTAREFDKTVQMINDFKQYFISHDQQIYENPSPGNKAGGITTLEEKSLGCTQKGGGAEIVDVLGYAQRLTKRGLNLLNSPGNDLVAATAEAVSGAHLILFTTGRGTPFGAPVPTIKISTNTPLFENKSNWIDFNAGELVHGQSMEALSQQFYDYIKQVSSGELQTKTEQQGIRDVAIFKNGVTL